MTIPPLPFQTPPHPDRDLDHLNTLAILSYVWGGIVVLLSCFGLIYVVIGAAMVATGSPAFATPSTNPSSAGPPPAFLGWLFAGFGIVFVLIGWTVGGLNIYSGRCMHRRKYRIFSLVMAGLNCTSFPFGTAMGVFTFIVLLRESVVRFYAESANIR